MRQQAWQSRAPGKDLRVEVASCDAVDQLHNVPVPDRPGWVTHHQLLPGEGTPKRKWLNWKWLNYIYLHTEHDLVMTKLLGWEAAGRDRHLSKKMRNEGNIQVVPEWKQSSSRLRWVKGRVSQRIRNGILTLQALGQWSESRSVRSELRLLLSHRCLVACGKHWVLHWVCWVLCYSWCHFGRITGEINGFYTLQSKLSPCFWTGPWQGGTLQFTELLPVFYCSIEGLHILQYS